MLFHSNKKQLETVCKYLKPFAYSSLCKEPKAVSTGTNPDLAIYFYGSSFHVYAIDQFVCHDRLPQFPSEFCSSQSGTPVYFTHSCMVYQPAFSARIGFRSIRIGRYITLYAFSASVPIFCLNNFSFKFQWII